MTRARQTPSHTAGRFGAADRMLISRRVLDELIRRKLARTPGCEGVEALPVVAVAQSRLACNWIVPGWLGDAAQVARTRGLVDPYLRFLATQFDVAPD